MLEKIIAKQVTNINWSISGEELIGEESEYRGQRSWKYQSDYRKRRDNRRTFDSRSMSGSETGSEDQGRQGRGGGGPAGGMFS